MRSNGCGSHSGRRSIERRDRFHRTFGHCPSRAVLMLLPCSTTTTTAATSHASIQMGRTGWREIRRQVLPPLFRRQPQTPQLQRAWRQPKACGGGATQIGGARCRKHSCGRQESTKRPCCQAVHARKQTHSCRVTHRWSAALPQHPAAPTAWQPAWQQCTYVK
jgi:hypothetical protein